MASTPTRLDLLELDIDLRLYAVLIHAAEEDAIDARLTALLRMAYGAGYVDALTEPCRGRLCRDHGFQVPMRQTKEAGSAPKPR